MMNICLLIYIMLFGVLLIICVHKYICAAHFQKFKSSLTIGTTLTRTCQKDDFSPVLTERWTITDIGPNQVKLVDEHGWWTVWDIKDIYENTEWSFDFK